MKLKPTKVFAVGAILTAAVATAVLVVAQSAPPGGAWVVYIQGNESSMSFLVQADAAAAHMNKIGETGGTNGQCLRYHWEGSASPYTAAQWVNGVFVQNCSGSTLRQATDIASPLNCTLASIDDRCHNLFSPATERNAGPTCDDCSSSVDRKPEGTLSVGNPINVGTGNKYQVDNDFTVPGSPWLDFSRYYNSQYSFARGKAMGFRWRHSFDYALELRSNGVNLLRPDGSVRTFGNVGDTGVDRLGHLDYVLDAQGAVLEYKFDNDEGRLETYAKTGNITRIDFREGGYITFEYDPVSARLSRVVDHFGRAVQFAYDSKGRVIQVTSPAFAAYAYTYDGWNRLVTRVAPGAQTRTYGYDSVSQNPSKQIGLLTSINDETGAIVGKYTYDSRARASITEGALGTNKFTVVYGATSTSVTAPLGAVTTTVSSTVLGTPRVTSAATTCPGGTCTPVASTSSTFDAAGNVTAQVQANGSLTCKAYDSRNLLTRAVEGLPANADCSAALAGAVALPAVMTSVQWHSSMRLPLAIASPKQVVVMTYDTAGRVTTRLTSTTSDSTGAQGFSAQAGAGTSEAFTYNGFGQLTSYTGPMGDVTAYAYGTAGALTSVTNAVGQATLFSKHNGDGRPQLVTLPSGAQLQLAYDARGRLASSTLNSKTTTNTYFGNGRLATKTTPDGEVLNFTYDAAGRLTQARDQRGANQNYGYNLAGGALTEQTKTSAGALVLSTARVFDALNRVTQISGAHAIATQPAPYTP